MAATDISSTFCFVRQAFMIISALRQKERGGVSGSDGCCCGCVCTACYLWPQRAACLRKVLFEEGNDAAHETTTAAAAAVCVSSTHHLALFSAVIRLVAQT